MAICKIWLAIDKKHLYPAAPPLTCYKETMFPIVKKQVLDSVILDEEVDIENDPN
ncbi:hypothetical protein Hanom_Chr03g00204361 [Helianthus anomalus]